MWLVFFYPYWYMGMERGLFCLTATEQSDNVNITIPLIKFTEVLFTFFL